MGNDKAGIAEFHEDAMANDWVIRKFARSLDPFPRQTAPLLGYSAEHTKSWLGAFLQPLRQEFQWPVSPESSPVIFRRA
jgi:hypothetical protein